MHHATTHQSHCRSDRFVVPPSPRRRGPGRPPAAESPRERLKHIGALLAWQEGCSVHAIAMQLNCSPRSVYVYVDRARDYDAETIALALAEAKGAELSRTRARAKARASAFARSKARAASN